MTHFLQVICERVARASVEVREKIAQSLEGTVALIVDLACVVQPLCSSVKMVRWSVGTH